MFPRIIFGPTTTDHSTTATTRHLFGIKTYVVLSALATLLLSCYLTKTWRPVAGVVYGIAAIVKCAAKVFLWAGSELSKAVPSIKTFAHTLETKRMQSQ